MDVNNYQPISVLNVFSKIYERLAYKRLFKFLEINKIFSERQFGFRTGRSTETATNLFCKDIIEAFEENSYVLAVFIDLRKAFDTVNHSILLQKLNHYGVRGLANSWFSSYLSDRTQYVDLRGASSSEAGILCGVPHGSILGPLLFLLYVNDLLTVSTLLKAILFADDTTLYISGKRIEDLIHTVNVT